MGKPGLQFVQVNGATDNRSPRCFCLATCSSKVIASLVGDHIVFRYSRPTGKKHLIRSLGGPLWLVPLFLMVGDPTMADQVPRVASW